MPGPLIVSLAGKTLLPKEKELLSRPEVGGVVLFRENFDKDADEETAVRKLNQLVKEIRACNPDLLIMVDHEGGKVWRFEKGFTKLPPAKELGDLYDSYDEKGKGEALKVAYNNGAMMAEQLLACDIDMSLAPVVDLDGGSNVISKLSRAFHKDPKIVAEIAEQFIRGMNDKGMPATLKHFPGHGSARDSHIQKSVDNRPIEELQNDLYPFETLIKKGLNLAVMPAHVTYPAVDPDNAAGFSKVWLQGCLRMGCGFNGVVLSDCLLMKGADVGSVLERIQAAQTAGCDFSMYTHQHGEDLDKLLRILKENEIPDNKDSAERRRILAQSIKKRSNPLKLSPELSLVLVQTQTDSLGTGMPEKKERVEKESVLSTEFSSVVAQLGASDTTGQREELVEKEQQGLLNQFSIAKTSTPPPYSVLNTEESEPDSSKTTQQKEKPKEREKIEIT